MSNTITITFTACKFLDFEAGKYTPCSRNAVGGKETHLCWHRHTHSDLVQFCEKRGRLNDPMACIGKDRARCDLYEEFEHAVSVSDEELESP